MELLAFPWIATLSIISITLALYFYARNKNPNNKLAPEADGGWPIIGHTLLLSGPDPLHITLSNVADKTGPVYSIRLGIRRGLVINSWEAAKECYKTNDVAFAGRRQTAAMDLMGYNFAVLTFSNYGAYWRAMRKVVVQQLLSNSKVDALEEARGAQTRAMMRECAESKGGVVDMRKVFGDMNLGLMCATVGGERDPAGKERWRETLREFFELLVVFTISDFVPGLEWVDRVGGMHQGFKRTGEQIDRMLQAWLDKYRTGEEEVGDFMAEITSAAHSLTRQFPSYDADTITKATCQTLMIGGTDTSSVALTWALSLLLNNRHTLERAQQELDLHVGRDRLVQESDIEKLVYIQAIVKETLRLLPPIPISPREAREDCVVAGYHVPKGTWLFINTWKIQRDPRVWTDPLEFKPERFLTTHKDVDVHGQHYELLPFGGGRRVCPAIYFALRAIHFSLATFLHGFDVNTPSGEAVDIKGSSGATNMKATPLEVCLKPRLLPRFYA